MPHSHWGGSWYPPNPFYHISKAVLQAAQSTYAFKVLKSYGLLLASLTLLCRSNFVSRLLYASPWWWGCLLAANKNRLQSVLNRAAEWGLYQSFDIFSLCNIVDITFFRTGSSNIFLTLLTPPLLHSYNLCSCSHPFTIPQGDSFTQFNCIRRMLFL